MTCIPRGRSGRSALALIALAVLGSASATAAHAAADGERRAERLVVHGEDTVVDGACAKGACSLTLTRGRFRGTPVGTGAYIGSLRLAVAEAFPNGEGGVCAPVRGRLVLGAGSRDRLVLALAGVSCQDGSGPVTEASFTTVTRFTVVRGHGAFAHARGRGLLSASEDAADRSRLRVVGRIVRRVSA
jgi:hypothetical protein